MRSRYAAYSRGLIDYIVQTSGEGHDDLLAFRAGVEQFARTASFGGLKILSVEPGETVAYVTFRASVAFGDVDASFTERSRFEKTDRWKYVSGERL